MGIPELLDWLRSAPPGTTVVAEALAKILERETPAPTEASEGTLDPELELTWRERIWLVPAETRMATTEVLEALGHSRSWLYKHLSDDRGPRRLPHRKLDGELVFAAGEVRAWLRGTEEVVAAGPMESTPAERRLFAMPGGA